MLDILVLTVAYALLILVLGKDRVGAPSQQHHPHQDGYNRFGRHDGKLACSDKVLFGTIGLETLHSLMGVSGSGPVEESRKLGEVSLRCLSQTGRRWNVLMYGRLGMHGGC